MTSLERRVTSGELVAELATRAAAMGANHGSWPGLTIYRFPGPGAPPWEEVPVPALCVIAQGRVRITIDGDERHCDPFTYLTLPDDLPFHAEILEASRPKPFLSFVLEIDPAQVQRVSSDMLPGRRTAAVSGTHPPSEPNHASVSAVDCDLMDAILRFLRALSIEADSRILAPIYQKEIVYRVLQAEQHTRLVEVAATEGTSNPVSAVIAYVHEHIGEPLSVRDLADRAYMSTSAFSHLFRDVTGRSPYQFVKDMRLDRARELLIENESSVTQISKAVGYRSTSHFINEFRERYGMTPRAYSDVQTLGRELDAPKNARRA